MEDWDIVDELETNVARGRTNFLSVLCILTWVGSGLAILFYAYMFLLFSGVAKAFGEFSGNTSNAFNWMLTQYLVGMIAPVVTITGAVFMWRLKRLGFYIYAVGQLVPIVLSFYIAIAVTGVNGSGILFSAILPNVIAIGFFIMYAMQVKDLNN